MNIAKYLNRLPFKRKLSLSFFLIIISMISLILVINIVSSYQGTELRIRQSNKITNKQIAERLNLMFQNSETALNLLTTEINDIVSDNFDRNIDYTETFTESPSQITIRNQFLLAMDKINRAFSDISSVVYVNENKTILTSNNKIQIENYQKFKDEFVETIPTTGSPAMILFPYGKIYPEKLFLGRRVINIETGKNIGYLFLVINQSTIHDFLPIHPPDFGYNFFGDTHIFEEGRLVTTTASEEDVYQRKEVPKNRSQFIFEETVMPVYGWRVVNETPVRAILYESITSLKWMLLVGGIVLVISILLITYLANVISSPIILLKNALIKVREGNLNYLLPVNTQDEIGILTEQYNLMIEQLKKLISDVEQEQKKKKEYELSLVTAQIKPHFLYNTLDLIYVLCSMGKNEEAIKVTKGLADFYRTSLDNGQEIVTLKEEKKNIESYLYIQKNRYSDKLQFDIEIPEKLLECLIPKLTLQPIVENAIYHGLRYVDGKGKINIEASLENNRILLIKVRDTGQGMTENMASAINTSQYLEGHFGLKNVKERLKMYFSSNADLQIIVLDIGIEVRIYIPLSKGVE